MKKNLFLAGLVAFSIFFLNNTFAETKPTQPTSASHPLPTLSATQNIDTVLSEKVQSVIAKLPSLKGQAITAASHDQVITLEGSVSNEAQEKEAIKAAYSVKEVKSVKSQLTIKLIGK